MYLDTKQQRVLHSVISSFNPLLHVNSFCVYMSFVRVRHMLRVSGRNYALFLVTTKQVLISVKASNSFFTFGIYEEF